MLEQLLQVRRRLANVVGYATHADVMFTRAMASPKQVANTGALGHWKELGWFLYTLVNYHFAMDNHNF